MESSAVIRAERQEFLRSLATQEEFAGRLACLLAEGLLLHELATLGLSPMVSGWGAALKWETQFAFAAVCDPLDDTPEKHLDGRPGTDCRRRADCLGRPSALDESRSIDSLEEAACLGSPGHKRCYRVPDLEVYCKAATRGERSRIARAHEAGFASEDIEGDEARRLIDSHFQGAGAGQAALFERENLSRFLDGGNGKQRKAYQYYLQLLRQVPFPPDANAVLSLLGVRRPSPNQLEDVTEGMRRIDDLAQSDGDAREEVARRLLVLLRQISTKQTPLDKLKRALGVAEERQLLQNKDAAALGAWTVLRFMLKRARHLRKTQAHAKTDSVLPQLAEFRLADNERNIVESPLVRHALAGHQGKRQQRLAMERVWRSARDSCDGPQEHLFGTVEDYFSSENDISGEGSAALAALGSLRLASAAQLVVSSRHADLSGHRGPLAFLSALHAVTRAQPQAPLLALCSAATRKAAADLTHLLDLPLTEDVVMAMKRVANAESNTQQSERVQALRDRLGRAARDRCDGLQKSLRAIAQSIGHFKSEDDTSGEGSARDGPAEGGPPAGEGEAPPGDPYGLSNPSKAAANLAHLLDLPVTKDLATALGRVAGAASEEQRNAQAEALLEHLKDLDAKDTSREAVKFLEDVRDAAREHLSALGQDTPEREPSFAVVLKLLGLQHLRAAQRKELQDLYREATKADPLPRAAPNFLEGFSRVAEHLPVTGPDADALASNHPLHGPPKPSSARKTVQRLAKIYGARPLGPEVAEESSTATKILRALGLTQETIQPEEYARLSGTLRAALSHARDQREVGDARGYAEGEKAFHAFLTEARDVLKRQNEAGRTSRAAQEEGELARLMLHQLVERRKLLDASASQPRAAMSMWDEIVRESGSSVTIALAELGILQADQRDLLKVVELQESIARRGRPENYAALFAKLRDMFDSSGDATAFLKGLVRAVRRDKLEQQASREAAARARPASSSGGPERDVGLWPTRTEQFGEGAAKFLGVTRKDPNALPTPEMRDVDSAMEAL
jgi:hypothetical protein